MINFCDIGVDLVVRGVRKWVEVVIVGWFCRMDRCGGVESERCDGQTVGKEG